MDEWIDPFKGQQPNTRRTVDLLGTGIHGIIDEFLDAGGQVRNDRTGHHGSNRSGRQSLDRARHMRTNENRISSRRIPPSIEYYRMNGTAGHFSPAAAARDGIQTITDSVKQKRETGSPFCSPGAESRRGEGVARGRSFSSVPPIQGGLASLFTVTPTEDAPRPRTLIVLYFVCPCDIKNAPMGHFCGCTRSFAGFGGLYQTGIRHRCAVRSREHSCVAPKYNDVVPVLFIFLPSGEK